MNNLTPLALTGLLALSGCSLSESVDIANNNYQNLGPNQLFSEQGTLLYSDDFDQGSQQWVIEKTDKTKVTIVDEAMMPRVSHMV